MEGEDFDGDKKGTSTVDRAYLLDCTESARHMRLWPRFTDQYGLRTARHGALHATGSYCSNGVPSVFSFKGVYKALIGTSCSVSDKTQRIQGIDRRVPTRRDASYATLDISIFVDWETYHARAGKCIPAETNTISVLDLTPLVLDRVIVHCD